MKLLSTIKRNAHRSLLSAVVAAAVVVGGLGVASALTAGSNKTVNCDNNAVMYCGALSSDNLIHKYDNGDGKNSKQSIHDIYSYSKFGISSTEVHALGSTAVQGTVTKSGNVIVNSDIKQNGKVVFHKGDVVATGAVTAGRQPISGSHQVTSGSTTFYWRTTQTSFASNSLDAYVVMTNGKFNFAILASCANPVAATPKTPPQQPATPSYTINKQVKVKGTNSFSKSVSNLAPGTHVIYQVVVNNTSAANVTNLKVNDVLPSHVQYVSSTLTRDGKTASSSAFFGSGVVVGTLAAHASTTFQFEAVVGPNDTAASCQDQTLTNTGKMTATSLPPKSSTATVSEKCVPAPVCTNFDISANTDRTVKVTDFSFKANGATFVNAVIKWGDTSTNTTVTNSNQVVGQTHQFSEDKTYTIAVTVNFTQNGKAVAATGASCQKNVTFKTNTPPAVTTPPTKLTNTGPGSVAGLFAAVTIVGAFAHRLFLARRLS